MTNTVPPPVRGEFRTGWGLLLIATIGTAVTGTHFIVTGSMMRLLQAAYGWSRGEIGFAITIGTVVMAIAHVPVGILVDRYGPRRILIPGTVLFGLCTVLFGLAGPALWTWYAAYTLFSIGLVPTTAFVWMAAVVRHFKSSRGLALSMVMVGPGVLTAMLPSIILKLVTAYGIRETYFILALASVVLMLPGALLFIKAETPGTPSAIATHDAPLDAGERKAILRDSVFVRLGLAFFIIALCVGIFSVHLQPMLVDLGLSPAQAAHTGLYIGPSFIVSALGSGVLLDKFGPRLVSTVVFVFPGLTSALLLLHDGSPMICLLIGFVAGCTLGAATNMISFSTSHYFAPQHFGFVNGIFFGLLGFGIGIGSWLGGYLFDISGGYASTHSAVITFAALSSALVFSIRRGALANPVPA